jgi:hypothetical protein
MLLQANKLRHQIKMDHIVILRMDKVVILIISNIAILQTGLIARHMMKLA